MKVIQFLGKGQEGESWRLCQNQIEYVVKTFYQKPINEEIVKTIVTLNDENLYKIKEFSDLIYIYEYEDLFPLEKNNKSFHLILNLIEKLIVRYDLIFIDVLFKDKNLMIDSKGNVKCIDYFNGFYYFSQYKNTYNLFILNLFFELKNSIFLSDVGKLRFALKSKIYSRAYKNFFIFGMFLYGLNPIYVNKSTLLLIRYLLTKVPYS